MNEKGHTLGPWEEAAIALVEGKNSISEDGENPNA